MGKRALIFDFNKKINSITILKKYIFSVLLLSFSFSQRLTHTEVFNNGNIKNITTYKKKKNRVTKVKYEEYFENGQKYSQSLFDSDEVNGLMTFWYQNGQKKEEATYKNGIETGIHSWWYENGNLKSKGSFNDGLPNGLWVYWYKSGQKSGEGVLKNGKQDGLVTEWHQNGKVAEERIYKSGKFLSKIEWDDEGNIKRK